ncbi:hypothetical protein GTZ97_16400 [Aquabacterium fontiphilum]|uniref:hypothetical protein n=1 Tax=Aquabacterium fontiphilum TaxID=450365 RepID=UPI0013782D5C|nr:hypothetical protein [Aquabacterium fontiphilum]NBD22237.1 hypothetical protein [Aquabacterium fontiphilum]
MDLSAYSAEDRALIHKFRGVRGFELYMSGFGPNREESIHAIGVDDQGEGVVEMAFAQGGDSKRGGFWRPTGPYKYVDFKLYKGNTVKYHWSNGIKTGVMGHLYGQWRVPVAERVPDDLLDDLRKNRGGGASSSGFIRMGCCWAGTLSEGRGLIPRNEIDGGRLPMLGLFTALRAVIFGKQRYSMGK